MNSTNTQIGCSNFAPSVFNAWCLIQYRTNQFNGVTSYFLSVCMRIAMQFMDQRQPTSNFNNTNNICVQRTQNGEMWYKLNEIEVPIWIECDISLGHFVNPFGVAHTSVQIFMHLFFPFLCAFFWRTKNMNRCTFDEYSAWCMYDSCMKYEIDASKWKIKVMRTICRNSLSIGRNGMYPLRSN